MGAIHPNNTPTYALVTQLVAVTGRFYTERHMINREYPHVL